MIFNSSLFFLFFAVVAVLFRVLPNWRAKKIMLVIASYLFYSSWAPQFTLLLAFSSVMDWQLGKRLYDESDPRKRKRLLVVSFVVNFGILAFFKYSNFFLQNVVSLASVFGASITAPALNIGLPLGISYYTFMTVSYVIDCYRRAIPRAESFLDYMLLVSFFPHLVAGPILRAGPFLKQCDAPGKPAITDGMFLLSIGLFQKIVLADGLLGPVSDLVHSHSNSVPALDAWVGALAFAGQIYCDFAGYSTCAIGVAMCFGFQLPQNFNSPFASIGFSDFWQRWHITLSTWLRDYLYTPLALRGPGGAAFRPYLSALITMTICGLWHGASWSFILFGVVHGVYLVTEQALKRFVGGAWLDLAPVRFALWLLTFVLFVVSCVIFRAQSLAGAGMFLRSLAGLNEGVRPLLPGFYVVRVLLVIAGVTAAQWYWKDDRDVLGLVRRQPAPRWATILVWAGIVIATVMQQGSTAAFIYFQF